MDWTLFLTYLAACVAAGATGLLFPTGDWYVGLKKPEWTPPNYAFPMIWVTLYIVIAIAAARIGGMPGAGSALALWSLQIALNTLWTPVFFGLRRIRTGLLILFCLWLAVGLMTLAFFGLDFWAGILILPYLAWVSVALALNFYILQMNPKA